MGGERRRVSVFQFFSFSEINLFLLIFLDHISIMLSSLSSFPSARSLARLALRNARTVSQVSATSASGVSPKALVQARLPVAVRAMSSRAMSSAVKPDVVVSDYFRPLEGELEPAKAHI